MLALEADDGAATRSTNVTVTVSLPANNLSDGLTHWWRMNDDPSLKKTYDSAGTNTLSLLYDAFLQPAKTGYGLREPRTNAVCQAASVLTNAEAITFTAWLYFDDAYVQGASGNVYQRLYNCGPNFYILFNRTNNQIDLSTRSVDGGTTQFTWTWTEPKILSNQWYHIAVLFDRRAAATNSKQVMYVNGKRYLSSALGSAFSGAAAFTSPFLIGNTSNVGGSRNFDGVLDEMRVYSRFITDEEARLLAADPDNNHAPVLEGPARLTAKVARPVALQGVATDDGQPFGKTLSTTWTVVSGDSAKVLFTDASAPGTTATFTKTGDYVIMLAASDGELQAASLVSVAVLPTGSLVLVK